MSGQRVLLTGHNGYIGSVMAPLLRDAGHDVVGLDTGLFADCTLGAAGSAVPAIRKDIRDLRRGDLDGFDAVIHLAALSNDPLGSLDPKLTHDINCQASVALARLARDAGVGRFLFASSCIMYGMTEAADVDETAPLDPRTAYANSKVAAEQGISALAGDDFSPVFIRNGTVYGLSPRMRLDTVLNNFVADATARGRVTVLSDGTPWRPVIHIVDIARSFRMFLEAPAEAVHDQAFNNGADHLNYRILRLAEIAVDVAPGAELQVAARGDADQRTYRASFAKLAAAFPDFRFAYTPETGARELYQAFAEIGLSEADLDGPNFVRLRWLERLLESGRLDSALRWKEAA